MGRVYRPRMACRLQVPVFGATSDDVVSLPLRVRRAELESNDHNHADTLHVSAQWRDAGVDPRLIKSATCEFWMGNANELGVFTPTNQNLRFLGVMTKPRRIAKEGSGFQVDLEFHDYTAFFLEHKPFATAGVPMHSDTLVDAWHRICDHTGPMGDDGKIISSVKLLRDGLEFRGGARGDMTLASSVAERFGKFDRIAVKQGADAWAVWQQCVGMLGLISFIEKDKCIVTTSTEFYTVDTAPKLLWGHNILDAEEQAHAKFSDKGIGLSSYDPISGTTYEAVFPPPGDSRIRRKRVAAGKKSKKAPAFPADRYDWFEYHGVTDLDRLTEIAKRVWEERSRQELDGRIKTAEMFVDGVDESQVDLLMLRCGDAVRIEIDQHDKETLASLGSESKAREYLLTRGYSDEAATLIIVNMSRVGKLDATFHATKVRVALESDNDGGKFEVDIAYHNRIKFE